MTFPVVGDCKDDERNGEESAGDWNDNDGELGFPRDFVDIDGSLIDHFANVIFHEDEERVDPRVNEVALNRDFTVIGEAGGETSFISGPIIRTSLDLPTVRIRRGSVTSYVQL